MHGIFPIRVSCAACATITILLIIGFAPTGAAQTQGSYFTEVDTDKDGRISLSEYLARMSYAFQQMDHNHDEVLDTDEQLVPNAPRLTLAEHQARLTEQFRRQDRNKDGWLSQKELLAPPG